MALSLLRRRPPSPALLRLLSTTTSGAGDRRLRPSPLPNPNAPQLPEPLSALSAARLALHNRILTLLQPPAADLDEASALARHSLYSNCRPTIFTINAVLKALLINRHHAQFLALHRFALQSRVAPNVLTHNLLIQLYCDCGKLELAIEHFRLFGKELPFPPSPTSYRILVRGLVQNGWLDRAVKVKDDMVRADAVVYDFIMGGFLDRGAGDRVVELYEEFRGRGGDGDGIVCGNVMKGYFLMGMGDKAMEVFREVVGEGSRVRVRAESYSSVLDALGMNGRLNEAVALFDRIVGEHDPPVRIAVNVGTFNVMVDAYCRAGRYGDAISLFKKMGESRCCPDTASCNNLIGHLVEGELVEEAEELYREMGQCEIVADECTYVLLVEGCFRVDRADDAIGYFDKMLEVGLRPSSDAYEKVIGGLVHVRRLDEAKGYFDKMVEKGVKPNAKSYELLLKGYIDEGMLDDGLRTLRDLLLDESVSLSQEMKEIVEEALKREGRGEDMGKLYEEVEREKAERLAREAEEKARAEALAREEEARRKKEAAEKEAAAAKASAAAIEAVLGWTRKPKEELSNTRSTSLGLVEELKLADHLGARPEAEFTTESINHSGFDKELPEGAGNASEEVSVS